ncbi:hypothetical protein NZD89_10810 [Alicyclobacillus fastidiosus]|uniref:Uncharacterized protein n=1 Tax=Alicyclobacillus fastidiosus TaxID=392011 RepID=A0ABY6ZLW4_9BACL|nr:hypothetical protein [Alicyclobacillus fastidiosus]WAH43827.1 hypothetical protein NZD89_10810 [Alicyclobacillus fastidiosus]GMA60058.1 hypothetical protein GCM10025859_04980 [Alicyclobacillus fastidiosus]
MPFQIQMGFFNGLLLTTMLSLAEGLPWFQTGTFSFELTITAMINICNFPEKKSVPCSMN